MKKKRTFPAKAHFLFLTAIFLFFLYFASAAVTTNLTISTVAPYLKTPIPNFTWATNVSLPEAFDLDNYFIDEQGIPLNYWFDEIKNISIFIGSENKVSFLPDEGFRGIRITTFYASNGFFNASSNFVYLSVGTDEEAPKWFNATVSDSVIYQNSFVNLTTLWTDNVELDEYIFSIKQSDSWINYTGGEISGISGTSIYRIQVSAPAEDTVYWKFYCWDSSSNMNETAVQSFKVSRANYPYVKREKKVREFFPSKFFAQENFSNFSISPQNFKETLRKNHSLTSILKIRNTGTEEINLSISHQNLEKMIFLSANEFSIGIGNTEEVTIDFLSDKMGIGQYFGYINVNSSSELRKIPVILDIKDEELKFDLNVNVTTKQILAGENASAVISILNSYYLDNKTGNLTYSIKDLEGNIYDFGEEEINFSKVLEFERNLSLPFSAPVGEYLFYARLITPQAVAIDSDSFIRGVKASYWAVIKPFSLFFLILLLAIIFAILMMKYKQYRDRERTLTLYLMLMNLKKLLEEDKIDEALELYILVKMRYDEKVPKATIENKEELKKEIKNLLSKLKKQIPQKIAKEQKDQPNSSPSSDEKKVEEKK